MKKSAIYPGTFDPITFGHIDVIKKGLKIFDKIIVAVSESNSKKCLFDSYERIKIVNDALFKDLKFKKSNIKVISFDFKIILSFATDLLTKLYLNTKFFPFLIYKNRTTNFSKGFIFF